MQLLVIGGSVIATMLLCAAWLFVFRKMCCECYKCACLGDRFNDWDKEMSEASKSRLKVRFTNDFFFLNPFKPELGQKCKSLSPPS